MPEKEYQQVLDVGEEIDSYKILEVLGAGGFGVTYKAFDQHLNCTVAIKEYLPSALALRAEGRTVVPRSLSLAEEYHYGLEQFIEEGRTLACFKHPNIVRVTRYLKANGTAYLVMDYESGQSLQEYLSTHPNPPEEKLRSILVAVLNGLRVVHAQGYLHRDIKPANIYLRDEGEPLLIDFGAARLALSGHSQTLTGIVTAGYAPFEQYSAKAKLAPSSDLYAVGATFYRVLTGAPPVESPERIHSLQEDETDPLIPAVELGLDSYSLGFLKLIDWMMEPLPKDRPQTVDEVLAVLAPDEVSTERSVPQAERSTRINPGNARTRKVGGGAAGTVSSRRLSWAAGLLAVLGLVAGLAWLWPLSGQKGTPVTTETMPPRSGMKTLGGLRIVTHPAGAVLRINGAEAGVTPKTVSGLAPGSYKVTLSKKGYVSQTKKIFVSAGALSKVQVDLKRLLVPLRISAVPRTAKIEVLDPKMEYKYGTKVRPGIFVARVSAPGYLTRKVKVEAGIRRTLQGTGFYAASTVYLDHRSALARYNLKKFSNGRSLYYFRKLKKALVGTTWGITYILDLDPERVKGPQKNPHVVSFSVGKRSTYPQDIGGSHFVKAQTKVGLLKAFKAKFRAYAVAPDRRSVLIGTAHGKVYLYDIAGDRIVKEFDHGVRAWVTQVAFAPDGKRFASMLGRRIYVWDIAANSQLQVFPIDDRLDLLVFTPDGNRLVLSRSGTKNFEIIDAKTGKTVIQYSGHGKGVSKVLFDRSKDRMISASFGRSIKVWDLQRGKLIATLLAPNSVYSIALSKDGRYLFSAGNRTSLLVWDMQTMKLVKTIDGAPSTLHSLNVSDDNTLAVLSGREILVWDIGKMMQ